ncbi:MAG: hypothetical protein GYB64_00965 [Chloroflexi bacterium]|nr:hypothetical protein [Chloroflexota bacterium]
MGMQRGTVYTRRVNDQGLFDYYEYTFNSADELFQLCLKTVNPTTVDRIVLEGDDETGEHRLVTLKFQSVTRRNPD